MLRLILVSQKSQLKDMETKLESIAQALSTKAVGEIPNAPSRSTPASHHATEHAIPGSSMLAQDHLNTCTSTTAEPVDSAVEPSRIAKINEPIFAFLTPDDLEVLLDRYRRLMAPHMPFVKLPDHMTAQNLQDTEPFLLQAIAVVASFHDTARQQIMSKGLIRNLCDRLLINGEKALGLLQGLLIFSNWYNPHLYVPRNSTNILHLMMALATDLDLDRGPREKPPIHATMKAYGLSRPEKNLSTDERRAALGTFYLSSLLFTSFSKVDILQWSPWLADCSDTLAKLREYESDTLLVRLVQMQRITQEAMTTEHGTAPAQVYAKSLLSELDALEVSSDYGPTAITLKLQAAATRVAIWQRAFVGLTSDSANLNTGTLRLHLEGMWRCMEAVKAYMDIFLTLPIQDYPVISFTIFGQFAFALVMVIRAVSMQWEGWDVETLCDFIDLSTIMGDTANRYGSVSSCVVDGMPVKTNAFANIAAKLRRARITHGARREAHVLRKQSGLDNTSGCYNAKGIEEQHLPTPPDAAAADPLGFMGFDFWTGFDDPLRLWTEFDSSVAGL